MQPVTRGQIRRIRTAYQPGPGVRHLETTPRAIKKARRIILTERLGDRGLDGRQVYTIRVQGAAPDILLAPRCV